MGARYTDKGIISSNFSWRPQHLSRETLLLEDLIDANYFSLIELKKEKRFSQSLFKEIENSKEIIESLTFKNHLIHGEVVGKVLLLLNSKRERINSLCDSLDEKEMKCNEYEDKIENLEAELQSLKNEMKE